MKLPTGDVSYIIGNAISLNDSSGNAVPNGGVYAKIIDLLIKKAEDYENSVLSGVFIRMYLLGMQEKELSLSSDEADSQIWQLIKPGIGNEPGEPQ
ncbi:hypothetical protein, partial [Enterococcus faecalis]|uniref:hypothetical protein n=1 Tax=Enterococcus faecalis TaxID=1351 RepID=UPI00133032D0